LGSNEDLNVIESTVKLTISTIDSRNLKIPFYPLIPPAVKAQVRKRPSSKGQNARRRKSLYTKKEEDLAGWLRD
jgi:hypothetical protein